MDQLASAIGVSTAVVSRIERGEQRYNQEVLEAMANALDCTPAGLIGEAPAPDDLGQLIAQLSPSARAVVAALARHLADDEVDAPNAAEQNVLGCLLYGEGPAFTELSEEMFADSVHSKIYRAILETEADRELINPATVNARMGRYTLQKPYEKRGGLRYLLELTESCSPAALASSVETLRRRLDHTS